MWLPQKTQYLEALLWHSPFTLLPPAAYASVTRGGVSPPSFYTIIFFFTRPLSVHGRTAPVGTDAEAAVGVHAQYFFNTRT
jgi:hypothetical protein